MLRVIPGLAALFVLAASPAQAAVEGEIAFIFNTFSFLVHGFLVMLMAAGFAMLESGLVRTKNTAAICLKNIALYSIAGIVFYIVGYAVMYTDVNGGWIGTFDFLYNPSDAELALLNAEDATPEQVAAVVEGGYSVMSDWFFQMVFVATAASIVSGTLAERIRVLPFLIFTVLLSALIYPIQASWVWGGGWLNEMGFSDFAGSTLVHSTGGWAALAGALVLGARKGKYGPGGTINPMPGANLPLATLGTFILWFGWFGFNGGSQLALGSALDAVAISIVYVNTNLAAAAGVIAAMATSYVMYRKIDLTLALNGAIAGLVSITAGPDLQNHVLALAHRRRRRHAGGVRGSGSRPAEDRRCGGRDLRPSGRRHLGHARGRHLRRRRFRGAAHRRARHRRLRVRGVAGGMVRAEAPPRHPGLRRGGRRRPRQDRARHGSLSGVRPGLLAALLASGPQSATGGRATIQIARPLAFGADSFGSDRISGQAQNRRPGPRAGSISQLSCQFAAAGLGPGLGAGATVFAIRLSRSNTVGYRPGSPALRVVSGRPPAAAPTPPSIQSAALRAASRASTVAPLCSSARSLRIERPDATQAMAMAGNPG